MKRAMSWALLVAGTALAFSVAPAIPAAAATSGSETLSGTIVFAATGTTSRTVIGSVVRAKGCSSASAGSWRSCSAVPLARTIWSSPAAPHHLAVLARPGFVRAASRPPWHRPGQAALSFNHLLRQVEGGGLSPPHETAAPHGALTQLFTHLKGASLAQATQ
jgi:hypothetical protein